MTAPLAYGRAPKEGAGRIGTLFPNPSITCSTFERSFQESEPNAANCSTFSSRWSLHAWRSGSAVVTARLFRGFAKAKGAVDDTWVDRGIAISVLSIVPLVGFWPIMIGERSFFLNYDNVEQFYPWYQKLSQAIHLGYLPIWDANVLGGHSFAGEFQTGIFYPLNIAFAAVFGGAIGINIKALEWLLILHFVIASIGIFLVCRAVRFSMVASAIASTLFAYSGAFALRASAQTCIFIGDSLIPWAVLFGLLFIRTGKFVYAAFSGTAVGLAILAGHLQPPSIAVLLVFGLLVGEAIRKRSLRYAVKPITTVICVALVIGSPQLFFGFQYLSDAYRWIGTDTPILGTHALPYSTYVATAYSLPQFLNVLDPWNYPIIDTNFLFVGCTPLIVLLLALVDPVARKKMLVLLVPTLAIAILAAFSLIMLAGPATPLAAFVYSLPFSSAAVRELGRYAIVFQLFAAIAVGAALDGLGSGGYESVKVLRFPLALFGILGSLFYAMFVRSASAGGGLLSNLMILSLLAVLVLRGSNRRAMMAILVAIEVSVSLPAVANDTNSPSYPPNRYAADALLVPVERCFPTCRVAAIGDAYPANIGDVFPVQSLLGHGATMYQPYYDLLGEGGFDPHGFIQDALNVKYLITDHKVEGFRLVDSDLATGRYLYQRMHAFPRVYSYRALAAKSLSLNDVTFNVIKYSDLESEFEVFVPHAETIVFAEQFYPGWVVSVDGRPAQMLEASIAGGQPILRAVAVDAGRHHVTFEYPR